MNMNKKLFVVMIAFMAFAVFSNAETLLGKNYVSGSFGIVQFGDDEMDDVLGNGYSLGGAGNINLTPNIDLNLGVAYLWADGDFAGVEIDVTGLSAGAGLTYFFLPNEKVNPFISAGVGVVRTEVEVSGFGMSDSEDETDLSFSGGAGVELEATEEILVRLSCDYINVDSEDDVSLAASLGYWFSDQILGAIGGSYSIDSEDIIGTIGIVIKM